MAGCHTDDARAARAFLWHRGRSVDLGTLGGRTASAVAVNNLGHVAGTSDTPEGTRRAFLWRDGEMIAIDPPAGYEQTTAAWLTDRDEVFGHALHDLGGGGTSSRPYRWTVR